MNCAFHMGDVMQIKGRIAAVLVAVATAGGLLTAAAASAQAADTQAQAVQARTVQAAPQYHWMHLGAGLYGSSTYPAVRGRADYYSYGSLGVSVWNASRLAGRTLVVYVHGTWAGTMRVSADGHAHFYHRSGAPTCSAGTAIRVRTGSGTLVASGTFYRMGMM